MGHIQEVKGPKVLEYIQNLQADPKVLETIAEICQREQLRQEQKRGVPVVSIPCMSVWGREHEGQNVVVSTIDVNLFNEDGVIIRVDYSVADDPDHKSPPEYITIFVARQEKSVRLAYAYQIPNFTNAEWDTDTYRGQGALGVISAHTETEDLKLSLVGLISKEWLDFNSRLCMTPAGEFTGDGCSTKAALFGTWTKLESEHAHQCGFKVWVEFWDAEDVTNSARQHLVEYFLEAQDADGEPELVSIIELAKVKEGA